MTRETTVEKPTEIFCCYAREDHSLLLELKKHLMALQHEGLITLWTDIDISPGEEWERKASQQLDLAQIILLLVSPDFINSGYCYSVEMKRAMERHTSGEARVIPIILRPVHWEDAPFSKLRVLPTDGEPVTNWSGEFGRDNAFVDITRGIRKAIEEVKTQYLPDYFENTVYERSGPDIVSYMVNAPRSEQTWPSNVEHCPHS